MAEQSKFPEKLYCNITVNDDDEPGDIWAYEDLETAAQPGDEIAPIKVGIYRLVEVVEASIVTTVETKPVMESE
jgi:hypothetical protein